MKRLNLAFTDQKMEKDYLALEAQSNPQTFQVTLCFWIIFLLSFSIPSLINNETVHSAVYWSVICALIFILCFRNKLKRCGPFIIPIISILLSLNALYYLIANLNAGSKALVFLQGWSYSSIQILLANQFPRLSHKVASMLISFGLLFGVISCFDSEIFTTGVLIRYILLCFFIIYIFYTFEQRYRTLFQSFYSNQGELSNIKDILNNFPQSITIIDIKQKQLLFSNESLQSLIVTLKSEINAPNQKFQNDYQKIFHLFQTFKVKYDTLKFSDTSPLRPATTLDNSPNMGDLLENMEDIQLTKSLTFSVDVYEQEKTRFCYVLVSPITWGSSTVTAIMIQDHMEMGTEEVFSFGGNKDLTIATVAHELRTPLNGILGLLQITEHKITESKIRENIKLCKDNAHLLLSLVNSLLDIQQLRYGKLKLNICRVKVKRLLNDVLRLFQFSISQKKLQLSLDVKSSVPEYIYTDENRLKQILINLIGNALKFTFRGGIALEINQDADDSSFLKISVTDTGIGIKEEDKLKLFKVYSRVEESDHFNKNGVGLGLAISNSIVKLLGGDEHSQGIDVDSKFGSGSRFEFRILKSLENCVDLDIEQEMCEVSQEHKSWWELDEDLISTKGATKPDPIDDCVEDLIRPVNIGLKMDQYCSIRKPSIKDIEISVGQLPPNQNRKISSFDDVKSGVRLSTWIIEDKKSNSSNCESHYALKSSDKFEVDQNHGKPKGSLLIVDDNPFNLLIASNLLETVGYSIQTAMTGEEAIDKIKSSAVEGNHFRAIFMDCQMPIMDGFETTRMMKNMMNRKEMKQTPIIALTASVNQQDIEKCFECGMSGYLSKPLSKAHLLKTLLDLAH